MEVNSLLSSCWSLSDSCSCDPLVQALSAHLDCPSWVQCLSDLFVVPLLLLFVQGARLLLVHSDKYASTLWLLLATIVLHCSVRSGVSLGLHDASPGMLKLLYTLPTVFFFLEYLMILAVWQKISMKVIGARRYTMRVLSRLNLPMAMIVPLMSVVLSQWDERLVLLPIGVGMVLLVLICSYAVAGGSVSHGSPRATSLRQVKMTLFGITALAAVWTGVLVVSLMASLSGSNHAAWWWSMLLVVEFVSVVVIVFLLPHFYPFTSFPIPTQFNREWLTALFRESELMHYTNQVSNISSDTTLTGGCHSAVHKVDVTYEQATKRLPSVMIFKTLMWNQPLIHKLLLFIRSHLPRYFHNKELSYLNSYEIESRFYNTIAPQVRGIRAPLVYWNHCDRFNAHFGMILENVARAPPGTSLTDGQPNGFTKEETSLIVLQMAHFHAQFWDHPRLNEFCVWDVGGYYTGRKRMAFKEQVEEHWQNVVKQLGTSLPQAPHPSMGARLQRNQQILNRLYEKPRLKTLIHGDFKISNIFLHKFPPSPSTQKRRETSVHVIDWQWVGRGAGVVDLAYFLATSPSLDMVNQEAMKNQVTAYHSVLIAKGVTNYSFDDVWQDFRMAFVDFLVYAICCKWTKMTPMEFQENQEAQKDGLHLRCLPHASQLIHTAEIFLDSLGLE